MTLETTPPFQLRLVQLHDYKSYRGTVTVGPFSSGLTTIVGPNGAGKSTVIDGILFAFGAPAGASGYTVLDGQRLPA